MSTKIYKGFRLKVSTFAEALALINQFRPWVVHAAEAVMDASLAEFEACKKEPDANTYQLWLTLRENLLRDRGLRVPTIDTDFSLTLIPSEQGLLGVAYTEHEDWYRQWCSHPGVEEYAYWDNADRPDGISELEWEARGLAWEVLTKDPVCVQGFSIDLVDPNGPLPARLRQGRL